MTLKTLMESDIDDVFLNTDEFGVSVEYYPVKGGGKRTLTAALARGVTTVIEKGQAHETKVEVVTLLFKRDDTTGISVVSRGDTIECLGRRWAWDETTLETVNSFTIKWKSQGVLSAGKVNIGF